ncbi:MAG: hypothetical protein J6Y04_04405 [Bacteroidaceae bacterium]|nr:hypothetical protein [Bacteroidaceae bacterium]
MLLEIFGVFLFITLIVGLPIKVILEMAGSKDGCFLELISFGIGAFVAIIILLALF